MLGLIEFSVDQVSPPSGVSLTSGKSLSSSGSRRNHIGARLESRDHGCILCRGRFLGSCSGQVMLQRGLSVSRCAAAGDGSYKIECPIPRYLLAPCPNRTFWLRCRQNRRACCEIVLHESDALVKAVIDLGVVVDPVDFVGVAFEFPGLSVVCILFGVYQ